MDSIIEFINFIYDAIVSNLTLVICVVVTILLFRIITDNFILIVLLACLLSIAYKDSFNNWMKRRVGNIKINIPKPKAEAEEGFDGYGWRKYFNPTTNYNVANPEAGKVYWPLNYRYGYSGVGNNKPDRFCVGNTLFTAHPRRLVCSGDRTKHVRMHHTGAPMYTSNRPPSDVPSCQQVPCPAGIRNLWTMDNSCLHNNNNVVCWKCVDRF